MATPMKKKKNRSKLGRGLSALVDQSPNPPIGVSIPQEALQTTNINQGGADFSAGQSGVLGEAVEPRGRVIEVDVTKIVPNPHQPRRVFDEESLEELAGSIAEHGLVQPIVVRMVPGGGEGCYELVAGERRWRATCRTGQGVIRAIVLELDDAESAQLALIENIQREDLNAIERARGFMALSERFSMTQDQISTKVGISRSSVANFLRLLELDTEIQSMIASGDLGSGHGKVLLSCKDRAQRLQLAQQVSSEGWSVRMLEVAVQSYMRQSNPETNDEPPQSNSERMDKRNRIRSVLLDLETRLGERLSTKVKLRTDQSGTKGSITIDFYDLDHFDGLMDQLGVNSADELAEP